MVENRGPTPYKSMVKVWDHNSEHPFHSISHSQGKLRLRNKTIIAMYLPQRHVGPGCWYKSTQEWIVIGYSPYPLSTSGGFVGLSVTRSRMRSWCRSRRPFPIPRIDDVFAMCWSALLNKISRWYALAHIWAHLASDMFRHQERNRPYVQLEKRPIVTPRLTWFALSPCYSKRHFHVVWLACSIGNIIGSMRLLIIPTSLLNKEVNG